MTIEWHPSTNIVAVEETEPELVHLLHNLRILGERRVDPLNVRIIAVPDRSPLSVSNSSGAETVYFVVEEDLNGMYFPLISVFVVPGLRHPMVTSITSDDATPIVTLRYDGKDGQEEQRIGVSMDKLDTLLPYHDLGYELYVHHAIRYLSVEEPWIVDDPWNDPWVDDLFDDDDDDDKESLSEDAFLTVRVINIPMKASIRWAGGFWRYIPILHLAVASGPSEQRQERVYALPKMDRFTLRRLQRHDPDTIDLFLVYHPYDEALLFKYVDDEHHLRIHVRPERIELTEAQSDAPDSAS